MKKTTIGGSPLFRGLLCAALLLAGGGLLMAANPPTDFSYDLNKAGDGVVIKEYLGTARAVVIPGTIEGFPVTEIGDRAFKYVKPDRIVSVVIPDSVTRIGDSAFSSTMFNQVTLPKNLKTIGSEAFRDCWFLTTITIPAGVTSIGRGAFEHCERLTRIVIPEGVTTIDENVFAGCKALTTVTIPDSVTSIGGDAFFQCEALTTVNITVRPVEFPRPQFAAFPAFTGCARLSLAVRKKIQDCGYTGSF
ncbi:MAG: leucine-rich repeat domain-containing protein [Spirochaetaceae bacterium]|nr:leucine-rich repeat domain-containing protein [Spirochaetaceae bacterium]